MTLKKVAGISVAALMAVMMATTAQAAENGKYVQDSAGKAVKNSAGECVKAQFGSMPEGCEAAPTPPPAPKTSSSSSSKTSSSPETDYEC